MASSAKVSGLEEEEDVLEVTDNLVGLDRW
jgi:hypothetical protein